MSAPLQFPRRTAAPTLSGTDARALVSAVVSRAMLGENTSAMTRVDESSIVRATGSPQLGCLWAVVAGGERDPLTLARRSGLEPRKLAQMIGCAEAPLFTIPNAVARFERDARLRRAVEIAEALPEWIAQGHGAADLDELQRLVASPYGESSIPAADLRSWREATAPNWLVQGFVTRAGLALLSATAKAGKSFALIDLALRIASGRGGRWLGHFAITDTQEHVLYLDVENGSDRMRRRIRALVEGRSLTAAQADAALDHLHVIAVPESPSTLVNDGRLGEWLDARPCVLVIADPLRPLLPPGSDENSADAGRTLDALRAICAPRGAACIVADHDGKDGSAARGHSSKRDSPDALWHLERASRTDPTLFKLTADFARDEVPEATVYFRRDPVGDYGVRFAAATAATERTVRDRVLDLVRAGALECREYRRADVPKLIDADRRRVSEAIQALVDAGMLRLRGNVLEIVGDHP